MFVVTTCCIYILFFLYLLVFLVYDLKQLNIFRSVYRKCPKTSNTIVSDKMTYANNADPDQTAPEGAVWSGSTLFAIPLF